MTIEQEAREAAKEYRRVDPYRTQRDDDAFRDGYLAAAEPREKEIAALRARVAELEGMVPKWVNTRDLPNEYMQLVESGWNCCSACSHYTPTGAWMTLMVPPIPVPESKPNGENPDR